MPATMVINESCDAIKVFVSKFTTDGNDSWFTLEPGARDSWQRHGWECVGFKNAADTNRSGIYVKANSVVTFKGFDHPINVV